MMGFSRTVLDLGVKNRLSLGLGLDKVGSKVSLGLGFGSVLGLGFTV